MSVNFEKILETTKSAAGTPAGKIVLLAFGGVLAYRFFVSGKAGAGSSPLATKKPLSSGLPSFSGGGGSGGASPISSPLAAAGPTIAEQLAAAKEQADYQFKLDGQVLDRQLASQERTALFNLDLQKKVSDAKAAADAIAFNFWNTDINGNSKNFFYQNGTVADRGRTPSVIAGGAGPTKAEIKFQQDQAPIVAEFNRQLGALQGQFQNQKAIAEMQLQATKEQLRSEERRSNPFSSWGNFLNTAANIFVGTTRSVRAENPTIVYVPEARSPIPGGSSTLNMSTGGIDRNLNSPGYSDMLNRPTVNVA